MTREEKTMIPFYSPFDPTTWDAYDDYEVYEDDPAPPTATVAKALPAPSIPVIPSPPPLPPKGWKQSLVRVNECSEIVGSKLRDVIQYAKGGGGVSGAVVDGVIKSYDYITRISKDFIANAPPQLEGDYNTAQILHETQVNLDGTGEIIQALEESGSLSAIVVGAMQRSAQKAQSAVGAIIVTTGSAASNMINGSLSAGLRQLGRFLGRFNRMAGGGGGGGNESKEYDDIRPVIEMLKEKMYMMEILASVNPPETPIDWDSCKESLQAFETAVGDGDRDIQVAFEAFWSHYRASMFQALSTLNREERSTEAIKDIENALNSFEDMQAGGPEDTRRAQRAQRRNA